MMSMSATPPVRPPALSRTMLQTAVRAPVTSMRPSVRMPIRSDSDCSSLPNASWPTGETKTAELAKSLENELKMR